MRAMQRVCRYSRAGTHLLMQVSKQTRSRLRQGIFFLVKSEK